ncbi:MAG: paraquat-inducible protein B [Verrucomicrobiales bacterium]|jgi:paraquat-inducible protein B
MPVGEVKRVLIRFESENGGPASKPSVPVIFDMDVAKLSEHLGLRIDVAEPKLIERQIEQGLRARLEMQSILTGSLQVNLDCIDEAEPANARTRFEHDGSSYPIIPAVKSDIQEAKQDIITAIANLSETDFKGIADRLSKLIETLTIAMRPSGRNWSRASKISGMRRDGSAS